MEQSEYPTIDLAAWQQVGEGGNGKTYVNPQEPDVILKVNNSRLSTRAFVENEYNVSRAVKALGLSVPEVKRIVRVGEAYATESQLIKPKRSLSRICCDNPERTEEMAELLYMRGKEMFATQCDTTRFPNRRQQLMSGLPLLRLVSKKNRRTIEAFAQSIPECTTCVHGDFQMGNLILSGEQHYWIDLDRFGYGDPMFDVGHLFMLCNVYANLGRVRELFHMTLPQFHRFWDAFARAYTGQSDHADFDRQAGRFACMDLVLRNVFTKPSLPETVFFAAYIRMLVKRYFD